MSMNSLISIFITFFPKAGANIKPFFVSNKTFLRFFLKLFRKLLASQNKSISNQNFLTSTLSVLADANIQPFLFSRKTFLKYFLKKFYLNIC